MIGTHEAEPMTAVVVPTAHAVCAAAPVVATKKPMAAGVQLVAPAAAENVPTAQAVCEVAPFPLTKLPGLAGVCEVAPTIATKLPALASVQGALPLAEKLPATHLIGVNIATTAQLATMAAVVKAVPTRLPPQWPVPVATLAAKFAFAVTVNAVAELMLAVCAPSGVMLPFNPADAVTVKVIGTHALAPVTVVVVLTGQAV